MRRADDQKDLGAIPIAASTPALSWRSRLKKMPNDQKFLKKSDRHPLQEAERTIPARGRSRPPAPKDVLTRPQILALRDNPGRPRLRSP
jgi:hypothetical protein